MTVRKKLAFLLSTSPYLDVVDGRSYERAADDLIANGVTVQQWIPVTERLPEIDTEVLVCDIHAEFIEVYKFVKDDFDEYYWRSEWGKNFLRFNDVTHWIPLPEPPKEECS